VTYRAGSTCTSALGVGMGIVSSSGLRKSYLFDTAPLAIRERFCVFDAVPARTDTALQQLVGSFCGEATVVAAARDCSWSGTSGSGTDLPAANDDAPSTQASSLDPIQTTTRSPNGCDVCGTVASHALYVTLPPSFVADRPNMPMVVRFPRADQADITIVPPAGEQSFIVYGVAASDADVTVFAPGVVPEAKGQLALRTSPSISASSARAPCARSRR
jgi:hypothetical protein